MPDPPASIQVPATVLEQNAQNQQSATKNVNPTFQVSSTAIEAQKTKIQISTTVAQNPSTLLQGNEDTQIQIPTTILQNQAAGNQLKIPVAGQVEGNQFKIPVENEGDRIDIQSPISRLDLKKLSHSLDLSANRLLQNQLNGLLVIGIALKTASGAVKSLAEEPIDKQKTGEEIFNRITRIIPTGVDKERAFTWQDPNSGKSYRFQIGNETTKEGKERFLKAFELSLSEKTIGKEVFCISSLSKEEGQIRSWRVKKNDFTPEQIDSLSKASFLQTKQLTK